MKNKIYLFTGEKECHVLVIAPTYQVAKDLVKTDGCVGKEVSGRSIGYAEEHMSKGIYLKDEKLLA